MASSTSLGEEYLADQVLSKTYIFCLLVEVLKGVFEAIIMRSVHAHGCSTWLSFCCSVFLNHFFNILLSFLSCHCVIAFLVGETCLLLKE